MTANAIAAISIGPPTADATTQRTTNQELPGRRAIVPPTVRRFPAICTPAPISHVWPSGTTTSP